MPDLTLDNAVIYLLIVLPGLVAIKTIGLLIPSERRDIAGSFIDVIVYGMINAALWSPVLIKQIWPHVIVNDSVMNSWLIIVYAVVSPIIMVLGVYVVRVRLGRWLEHPVPTAWDYLFRQRRPALVLCHLKGGRLIAGYYGSGSFASTFPREPEIYLERALRVHGDGVFDDFVEDSQGLVIRFADCEFLELFEAKPQEGESHGHE